MQKDHSVEDLIAPVCVCVCVCVCVFLGVGCKDEGDQEELPSRANGVYQVVKRGHTHQSVDDTEEARDKAEISSFNNFGFHKLLILD